MKKIIVLLLLLIAAPVFADVTLTVTRVPDTNTYTIGYTDTGSPSPVRAFALDISLIELQSADTDINIIDVNCLWSQWGYKIYPGTIGIDAAGNVTGWGNCNCTTPLPKKAITVEMASLYKAGTDPAPPASGNLLQVTIGGTCGDANLAVTTNALRGGVVMENAAEAAVTLPAKTLIDRVPCYTGCLSLTNPDWAQWDLVGRPNCWCPTMGFPRQCRGDADGLAEGKGLFWVYGADLNILIGGWGQPLPMGTPGICADFDRKPEGKGNFRVYGADLNIMIANWGTNATPADCLP